MPVDPPGATAALGVLLRADGTRQLTVDGAPAYTFVGDATAGSTSGEGDRLGPGTFELLAPTGAPIPPTPAATTVPTPPPPVAVPRRTIPAPPPVMAPAPAPVPQGNGGDHDGDNRGGSDDRDGGV